MWLGSTVELLAGALPYNEEIVDLYICYWEGVPPLSSVRWRRFEMRLGSTAGRLVGPRLNTHNHRLLSTWIGAWGMGGGQGAPCVHG